jgi:hypothetical protein
VVSQRVPVIDHPPFAGDEEARAVNHIRPILHERAKHLGIFGRVVFQIRVLDDAEFASRILQSRPNGGALASVLLMVNDSHPVRVLRGEVTENLTRTIGGTVVYRNHFAGESCGQRRRESAVDGCRQELFFVIDRNEDGQ